ncbi:MAG: nitroreductase family protein [Chloroflexota bacterium]|nr:nitroreductase family protein [Chloroflexota bacterium]
MHFDQPITELIEQRFSCRTYQQRPIAKHDRARLADFIAASGVGPLGNRARFELVAAQEGDSEAVRGLGTYGFIKGAGGFIIGATNEGDKSLQDYGYMMESIILRATDLGLGTCWLGGTFTRSRFAKKISRREDEIIPAVTSVGYMAESPRRIDQTIRNTAGSNHRFGWEKLFFDNNFGTPITKDKAGDYAIPLKMVRLGPSASNKQPWRIVKAGDGWHFYLRRTPGYPSKFFTKLLKLVDLQRIDMGIAICHFELASRELGLEGEWVVDDPGIETPNDAAEYAVTWR